MIETNIRIVAGGPSLELWVRQLTVTGADVTNDRVERACGVLRYRHGLAAVPMRNDIHRLLVADREPVPTITLKDDNWELEVVDSGEPARCLRFCDLDTQRLVAVLIERRMLAELARHTELWTLDSPRIWYEPTPFHETSGIRVFRRFQVSTIPLEDVGIGVAVDVGRAFFTGQAVSFFFDDKASNEERRRRIEWFEALTNRQRGQKGTLLYDNGTNRLKCYFEQAPSGVTCGTTGRIRLRAESYDSLADYYRARYPKLGDMRNSPAVRVGFGKLGAQWVSAERLWVRVMNDDLPERLTRLDKLRPAERRAEIEEFWKTLESRASSKKAISLAPGFWRPAGERVTRFRPTDLEFGGGVRLTCQGSGVGAVREHFHQRETCLNKGGCFDVPAATSRRISVVYPKRQQRAGQQLADDLTAAISSLTGLAVDADTVEYATSPEASERLSRQAPGMALFVLDEEPEAYYDVAFALRGWRIKRVTEATLSRHFTDFEHGAVDRKTRIANKELGQRRWHQFVHMTALDVLQKLDLVLWRIGTLGPYDAQVVIDVGHDRRHVAVSILVARESERRPSFRLATNVQLKADHQLEAINATLLADQVVALIENALPVGSDPLTSITIVRDGRLVAREIEGIRAAITRLRTSGRITTIARVDLIDLHKDSQKALRLWSVNQEGEVRNVVEGTAVQLGPDMVLLATTGDATLRQGTVQPLLIVAKDGTNALDATEAFCAGAQLNWSSPRTAQRYSLPLKRTDDELKERSAQEVRRLR